MTIKELRDKTGLSQSKFATYVEIPLGTIKKWEQERQKPPVYIVKLIDRVLNCCVVEINENITIKELRERTGLSQSKFAAYFEIPVRTLQEWEQERRTPPDYVVKLMWKIWNSEKVR